MTTVINLAGVAELWYDLNPRASVIAAYAQRQGDWAWWDYEQRYGKFVYYGVHTVACGDWCSMRNPSRGCPTRKTVESIDRSLLMARAAFGPKATIGYIGNCTASYDDRGWTVFAEVIPGYYDGPVAVDRAVERALRRMSL